MEKKNTQVVKRVFKIVFNTIFYSMIALLIGFSIATMKIKSEDNIANIFGAGFLSVQSDSMEGDLKDSFFKGDMVFVNMLNDQTRKELQVGDIVTYFDTNIRAFNTHRIIEVVQIEDQLYYLTKGDNTSGDDGLLHSNQALAVYRSSVSGLGTALDYLQTPSGFALFIILPVVMILIFEGVVLIRNIMALNHAKLEDQYTSEKEKIRQQILAEMKKEQGTQV
ncbi:signal peptidase I [Peloplasma aerotolerans]|uniref:Signal peptidase I n=1 Tax=Peloplasma aerotolerans TaxID=3044389 RepID=A0AAW6U3C4_9MOLU|nr:signal peptidase I [Mariniplasma sp. M4Ah]MDI6452466.1 signal peptidase I [Mariniplasma sp. M4Ah]